MLFSTPVFAMTPQQVTARVTCYAPGADPRIEGPFATSRPGPNGGQNIPKTLDDFRLERSNYVTLAAHPARYGQWFNMGTITYVSNLDSRRYTIQNVIGYVHDTGCAFMNPSERGSCCQRYGTCGEVHRKFDVAYGDYRSGGNVGLVNSGPICGNVLASWQQIGGPLNTPPQVTAGDYVYTYDSSIARPGPGFGGFPGAAPYQGGSGLFPANNVGYPTNIGYPTGGSTAGNGGSAGGSASVPYYPNTSQPVPGGTSVFNLVLWPKSVQRGGTVTVVWTSVNMAKDSCQVLFDGQEFAKSNEGSKPFRTVTSDPGTISFTLRCQHAQGQYKEQSASATIQ